MPRHSVKLFFFFRKKKALKLSFIYSLFYTHFILILYVVVFVFFFPSVLLKVWISMQTKCFWKWPFLSIAHRDIWMWSRERDRDRERDKGKDRENELQKHPPYSITYYSLGQIYVCIVSPLLLLALLSLLVRFCFLRTSTFEFIFVLCFFSLLYSITTIRANFVNIWRYLRIYEMK